MTPLTQEFVDSCPIEGGFRMRGLEMTRLEVFIDAAFAFAVTMLVVEPQGTGWELVPGIKAPYSLINVTLVVRLMIGAKISAGKLGCYGVEPKL